MSEKKRKPSIRFKGFQDEWKEEQIKDVLSYERPDKYIVKSDKYLSAGVPVLTANKSFVLGYTNETNTYKKALPVIIFDDFTLDNKLVDFPFMVKSSAIKILTPKNFSDIYFDYNLIRTTPFIMEGHARHYISIVQKKKVNIPKVFEQQKIGTFFAKLDQLLDLQQQKLDQLELLKKVLLQKLFPKQGTKIPELRFKGFEDEWKQDTISNIAVVTTGNTPSTNKKQYYSTKGIPWVTPSNINKEGKIFDEKHLSEQGVKVARIVPKGSVLVTSIASIGKNTLVKTSTAFNQQINAITPKESFDSYFIYISSIGISKKMKTIASTGTMQIINKREFSEMEIQFPSISEQQKIGNLFAKVDRLIELENKKFSNLKLVKKSLLQNMFVK
ncbi:restriction endonuclease subunit S [Lactobacillus panisapium]|uniref:restriction endonuclease subunit S n=1 Tax=Lactobacillus panisapium TaxID=2012495 RepID=UPI001C696CA1|nr:restriction endonuclease subunit S [Lactobacillus panisapium]QYN56216.1 restriction endonuclease subunit S [Lactobacillus panisapium]